MKIKFFILSLLLVAAFAFAALGQKGSTDSAGDPTRVKLGSTPQTGGKKGKRIVVFGDTERMFEILDGGRWLFSETDCAKAFAIKVSPDRKSLKLIYPKTGEKDEREYVYKVLEVGSYYIRTQIEGEKRLTGDGKPVVWDFWFVSDDEFLWHRTDWPAASSTSSVTRCRRSEVLDSK
jgi:hypothetical protein